MSLNQDQKSTQGSFSNLVSANLLTKKLRVINTTAENVNVVNLVSANLTTDNMSVNNITIPGGTDGQVLTFTSEDQPATWTTLSNNTNPPRLNIIELKQLYPPSNPYELTNEQSGSYIVMPYLDGDFQFSGIPRYQINLPSDAENGVYYYFLIEQTQEEDSNKYYCVQIRSPDNIHPFRVNFLYYENNSDVYTSHRSTLDISLRLDYVFRKEYVFGLVFVSGVWRSLTTGFMSFN